MPKYLKSYRNLNDYNNDFPNLLLPNVSAIKNGTYSIKYNPKSLKYKFIDMGLSVDWATCNIGATKPEELGHYFMWGGTTAYNSDRTPVGGGEDVRFDWSNYPLCNGSSSSMTKYCIQSSYGVVDNKAVLELEDDAAYVHIGSDCRMPTETEYKELLNACNTIWVTDYNGTGINGRLFTLKSDSSKTLFFPASGYMNGSSKATPGSYGRYWSSSIDNSYSNEGQYLHLYSSSCFMSLDNRCHGFSIRAVRIKKS